MNSSAIRIHIWLHILYLVKCSSLVNILKIMGRNSWKMWLVQDVIYFPYSINNWCCENLLGVGCELVATGHIDHMCWISKAWSVGIYHMCWVSKTWWVGLVRLGFRCWLGDLIKTIFFNIIDADNMVPLDGVTRYILP